MKSKRSHISTESPELNSTHSRIMGLKNKVKKQKVAKNPLKTKSISRYNKAGKSHRIKKVRHTVTSGKDQNSMRDLSLENIQTIKEDIVEETEKMFQNHFKGDRGNHHKTFQIEQKGSSSSKVRSIPTRFLSLLNQSSSHGTLPRPGDQYSTLSKPMQRKKMRKGVVD